MKDHVDSQKLEEMEKQFYPIKCRYQAAISEVVTKLEILNTEFQQHHDRNPIHHIDSRLKTVESMYNKLVRKGLPLNLETAIESFQDIAGIRVICSYLQDIYTIQSLLLTMDDLNVLRIRNYIAHPKPNGYRSLHIVAEIPVYLSEGRTQVPVEIQIRTIAMDFWATLEHSLRYKSKEYVPSDVVTELMQVAEDISNLDSKMQSIHDRLDDLEQK